MSLDLYIESNTPVLHRGTGVYIRENGETKELETKEEVLKHFPDVSPDDVVERTYESSEYFHMNLTHNLTKMADECKVLGKCFPLNGKKTISLYDLLWHPDENLGITDLDMDYLHDLQLCYMKLTNNPEFFKKYNPKNGWGSYDGLCQRTKEYIAALESISDSFEDYHIVADT